MAPAESLGDKGFPPSKVRRHSGFQASLTILEAP